jgi:hypothetical protein
MSRKFVAISYIECLSPYQHRSLHQHSTLFFVCTVQASSQYMFAQGNVKIFLPLTFSDIFDIFSPPLPLFNSTEYREADFPFYVHNFANSCQESFMSDEAKMSSLSISPAACKFSLHSAEVNQKQFLTAL